MKSLKIFEVINCLGAGGAETLLKDLSIGFQNNNHQVFVIILDTFSQDISEIEKINTLQKYGIITYSLGRKPGHQTLNPVFEIYSLLKKHQPDVVHIHSFLAGLFFFPFSISKKNIFFQTIHNTQIFENKLQKFVFSKLFKRNYKNIFCSEEAHHSLHQLIGKGIVIDNGIPNNPYSNIRLEIEQEFVIPKGSFIGLNVGRITKQKNHLLLLDLVEQLNKTLFDGTFYLLICGKNFNDALFEEINQKRNNLTYKNNIKFIGVRNDIINLMHSVDVYLSTSIHEGLPITVLEALNTGVPIILSPIKEHLNVFKNTTGCYFPEKNEVNSYIDVFEKEKNIKEFSKESLRQQRQDIIAKYSIDNTINKYLNHFNTN